MLMLLRNPPPWICDDDYHYWKKHPAPKPPPSPSHASFCCRAHSQTQTPRSAASAADPATSCSACHPAAAGTACADRSPSCPAAGVWCAPGSGRAGCGIGPGARIWPARRGIARPSCGSSSGGGGALRGSGMQCRLRRLGSGGGGWSCWGLGWMILRPFPCPHRCCCCCCW